MYQPHQPTKILRMSNISSCLDQPHQPLKHLRFCPTKILRSTSDPPSTTSDPHQFRMPGRGLVIRHQHGPPAARVARWGHRQRVVPRLRLGRHGPRGPTQLGWTQQRPAPWSGHKLQQWLVMSSLMIRVLVIDWWLIGYWWWLLVIIGGDYCWLTDCWWLLLVILSILQPFVDDYWWLSMDCWWLFLSSDC